MAMNENVAKVLEEQINKEFYSAYLYLTFADYYEERGLKGFANWYEIQVKEEVDHAMAIRRYLLDNDYKPTMLAIEKPSMRFENDLDPLKAGLAHEEYVTSLIHHCYEVAQEAHDIRALQMLDYCVKRAGRRRVECARHGQQHEALWLRSQRASTTWTASTRGRVYTQMTALPL